MDEDIRRAFEYILTECHKCPNDSVVDIANEAFEDLDFFAEWADDDDNPVRVGPFTGWEVIRDGER